MRTDRFAAAGRGYLFYQIIYKKREPNIVTAEFSFARGFRGCRGLLGGLFAAFAGGRLTLRAVGGITFAGCEYVFSPHGGAC